MLRKEEPKCKDFESSQQADHIIKNKEVHSEEHNKVVVAEPFDKKISVA